MQKNCDLSFSKSNLYNFENIISYYAYCIIHFNLIEVISKSKKSSLLNNVNISGEYEFAWRFELHGIAIAQIKDTNYVQNVWLCGYIALYRVSLSFPR